MSSEKTQTEPLSVSREQAVGKELHGGRGDEAGFSLLEGLFAAALLLVVGVSVLPLFMRALESNTRGGRSSQVATFATAEVEEVNQTTIDRADWNITTAGSTSLQFPPQFWDLGRLVSTGSAAQIGDEGWVDTEADAVGPILWTRDLMLLKYSFADIHTTIQVDGVTLNTLGDPRLFDTPLTVDADGDQFNSHITEFRVSMQEDRDGLPLAAGQRMTIGHYRTF